MYRTSFGETCRRYHFGNMNTDWSSTYALLAAEDVNSNKLISIKELSQKKNSLYIQSLFREAPQANVNKLSTITIH